MQENKKILLATSNQGKIKEFKKIFSNFQLISQDELGINEKSLFYPYACKIARQMAMEKFLSNNP